MRAAVRQFAWLALTALGCPPPYAAALVVAPPNVTNTVVPFDDPNNANDFSDPGWSNVGDAGVYLGNQWVLTVNHVGAGTTTFPSNGTTYPTSRSFGVQPGNAIRLHAPGDINTPTDLLMYRLAADPGLPALLVTMATPPVGDVIMLIGNGAATADGAQETHWDSTQTPWQPVASGGDRHGFVAGPSRIVWGTNRVENDGDPDDSDHTVEADSGSGPVISFFSDFDDPDDQSVDGATPSEAQATINDSGSAVFHFTGGAWVLAGITHAIGVYDGQPSVGLSAVYGTETYMADLSAYRPQIMAIVAIPEMSSIYLLTAVAIVAGVGWKRFAGMRRE